MNKPQQPAELPTQPGCRNCGQFKAMHEGWRWCVGAPWEKHQKFFIPDDEPKEAPAASQAPAPETCVDCGTEFSSPDGNYHCDTCGILILQKKVSALEGRVRELEAEVKAAWEDAKIFKTEATRRLRLLEENGISVDPPQPKETL